MAEEIRLRANGLEFFALADGPEDGPLVLLLHGFPELSRSWRHQLPALAGAGFRAVAPDQRGYGRTGRAGPYDLRTLSADAAGLVRALGRERAAVVGHDWGGAVAWGAAMYEPDVVERLAVLNSPHPAVLAKEIATNPRQRARSRYMFFFQIPWLPERLLSRNGGAGIARALRGGSHVKEAFPEDELAHYREAFSTPEAVAAPLGWYRAALRSRLPVVSRLPFVGTPPSRRGGRSRPVRAPTLVLWGVHDRFLGVETIEPSKMARYLADGNVPEIVRIEEAGHFVQNEAPERVNAELLRWLGKR
jgi:pimeloyl-ACP methyl ester carboxylesterase